MTLLGRGLKIYLHCIHAHKTDFAKGVVLLLRIRCQAGLLLDLHEREG